MNDFLRRGGYMIDKITDGLRWLKGSIYGVVTFVMLLTFSCVCLMYFTVLAIVSFVIPIIKTLLNTPLKK